MAARLTRGQEAFLDAVRSGEARSFHRMVTEPMEELGLVRWIGPMRRIGCNSFSAADFELVEGR